VKQSTPFGFSYHRFSDKRQNRGSSLHANDTAVKSWCERNRVTLNTKTYRDLGVSGLTGKHRQNPDRHGLALFLNGLKEGIIPKGSYLLLYNLDRLTREHIRPAYALFNEILDAGVHIVQLNPERVFRCDSTESEAMMDVFMAVYELSRANSESTIKSKRIKDNWQKVRQEIQEGKTLTLPTGKIPFWINKVNDGYKLNGKEDAVKLMFQLAKTGYGAQKVCYMVNTKFDLNLSRPYVRTLLRSPVVRGYWVPKDKSKKQQGEPLKIYPAAVDDNLFDEVQGAISGRTIPSKVRNRQRVYLFTHLMEDTKGYGFTPSKASVGRGKLKYIPVAYLDGKRGCISFPVEPFEEAMLDAIAEINPAEVMSGKADKSADELLKMTARRDKVINNINKASADLDDEYSEGIAAQVRKYEKELEELNQEMARLRHKVQNPQAEAWGDAKKLIAALKVEGNEELRTRFRTVCSLLIDRMVCIFHGHGSWRCAYVQVFFKDSPKFRVIVIQYRSAANTFTGVREPLTLWDTWKESCLDTPVETILDYMNDLCDNYEG
jgi:DNA invertase Pin-like site-specific DNA recombinase